MGSVIEESRLEGLVQAPDFPAGMEWLNTGRTFSLKDFQGRIVLLDFWTFCCINCMHVLPELRRLEEKYPEELVVIGVHSAKFTNEKGSEAIRQAILRYGIRHPVVNDKDFKIWRSYGVQAWPTLVLINPKGRIIGTHSGEDIFDLFDALIGQAAAHFEGKGELKRGRLELALEKDKQPESLLAFPGKVHADAAGRRLFITDSNHHRILVADLEGKILEVIGSGRQGAVDGTFEAAEFHHPQGTFLSQGPLTPALSPAGRGEAARRASLARGRGEGKGNHLLYIADTENHLIRAADLEKREVTTLLGTGQKARTINAAGQGTSVALNSPWDLRVHEGKLYIAMAGPHQIWAADLATFEAKPFAGSGREARLDGPLLQAALAQPSGIAADGLKLYFADSEVSSIRSADLDPHGKVETIVGEDLFEFGDVDGDAKAARLQHPLGVAYHNGQLFVADTYNSKIKIVDPVKKTSATFAGTGTHGSQDGNRLAAEFNEPAGLAILGDSIYIADTNNHSVRVLDLKTENVRTLELSGIGKPAAKSAEDGFDGRKIELPKQTLGEGESVIRFDARLPQGYKFAAGAPTHLSWKSAQPEVVHFQKDPGSLVPGSFLFPYEIPVQTKQGAADLTFEAVIYYCRETSSLCFFDSVRVQVPVEVRPAAPSTLSLTVNVEAKGD